MIISTKNTRQEIDKRIAREVSAHQKALRVTGTTFAFLPITLEDQSKVWLERVGWYRVSTGVDIGDFRRCKTYFTLYYRIKR